jgi:hypothetical protein
MYDGNGLIYNNRKHWRDVEIVSSNGVSGPQIQVIRFKNLVASHTIF